MDTSDWIVVVILVFVLSCILGACFMLVPYSMLEQENEKLKRQLDELVLLEELSSQTYRAMVWEAARNYQEFQQTVYQRKQSSQGQNQATVNSQTHI